MRTLHVFNPSHDDALAAGTAGFCPDGATRTLESDLSALPAWWAMPDDVVLLSDAAVLPAAPARRGVAAVRTDELNRRFWDGIRRIEPWGWDAPLAARLRRLGAPPHLLPDAGALESLRRLSSRQTAVRLLRAVRAEVPETVGKSHWCTDETDVWRTVAHYGTAMLKAPWSGSGRGVFRTDAAPDEAVRRRVRRLLRTQGGVEVEPFYDRMADLALEFAVADGDIRFDGLSFFRTTPHGGYAGNAVAGDEVLRRFLPPALHGVLDAVRHALCRLLPPLLGISRDPDASSGNAFTTYRGPLGVDMMVVHLPDGTPALHPCIELNLRRTMGHVALSMRPWLSSISSCPSATSLPPRATTPAVYRLRPVGASAPALLCLTPGARKIEAVLCAEP